MMKLVNLARKTFRYITDGGYRFAVHKSLGVYDTMPDDEYLCKLFISYMGYELNLTHPVTFNEKLQWLKLHDRRPEYTMMVDKYAVKAYVAQKIGEQYVIPTLGVWEHFDEIDFDKLPNQFVLKCTHDSGGGTIVKDKSAMDIRAAKKKLEGHLCRNFYYAGREWPYKNVPPRIIAEEYMKSSTTHDLRDYKFYCFHGKPKFLYVSEGLGGDHRLAKMNFVDLDWKKTPFQRPDFMEFDVLPHKPDGFDEMIRLSETLSEGIPFLRADWYSVNGQVYFSELTFYPGSGFTPFSPPEWEREIGEWISLPNVV